jgi:signal transduction histidine kinase
MHLDTFCWLRVGEGDGSERELSLSRLRLKEASAEVSRIVSWLQLSFSEDLDLSEAVRSYLSELADAEGWQYEFEDRLHPRRASRAVEAMAYRVMQEALNNAAKHAQTRKVKVSLREENGALVATVQDWGRGFDPKEAFQKSRRLGLRGMSTRAHLVGGTCTFDTLPGEGTLVVLRVPGAVSGGNGS